MQYGERETEREEAESTKYAGTWRCCYESLGQPVQVYDLPAISTDFSTALSGVAARVCTCHLLLFMLFQIRLFGIRYLVFYIWHLVFSIVALPD